MTHLGQYVPGESVIHRLDPRVKIVSTIVMGVLILWGDMPSLVLITLLLMFGVRASGLPFRHLLSSLRPVRFFLLLFLFLHLFLEHGEPIAFLSWGPICVTWEGLYKGVTVVWQFSLLIWGSSILTATTSPSGLVNGLERLLRPLKKIGVPSHDLAIMVSISLRFVPAFLEELERIRDAQTARGADFKSGGVVKRTMTAAGLLVPLILSFVRRAEDLVVAMEARGYGMGPRTYMYEMRMTRGDYAAITIIILLSGFHFLHGVYPFAC
jgi:energy-coupling factor transporter transmembrane protein EcfT